MLLGPVLVFFGVEKRNVQVVWSAWCPACRHVSYNFIILSIPFVVVWNRRPKRRHGIALRAAIFTVQILRVSRLQPIIGCPTRRTHKLLPHVLLRTHRVIHANMNEGVRPSSATRSISQCLPREIGCGQGPLQSEANSGRQLPSDTLDERRYGALCTIDDSPYHRYVRTTPARSAVLLLRED